MLMSTSSQDIRDALLECVTRLHEQHVQSVNDMCSRHYTELTRCIDAAMHDSLLRTTELTPYTLIVAVELDTATHVIFHKRFKGVVYNQTEHVLMMNKEMYTCTTELGKALFKRGDMVKYAQSTKIIKTNDGLEVMRFIYSLDRYPRVWYPDVQGEASGHVDELG
jgi:reverse gyrase